MKVDIDLNHEELQVIEKTMYVVQINCQLRTLNELSITLTVMEPVPLVNRKIVRLNAFTSI